MSSEAAGEREVSKPLDRRGRETGKPRENWEEEEKVVSNGQHTTFQGLAACKSCLRLCRSNSSTQVQINIQSCFDSNAPRSLPAGRRICQISYSLAILRNNCVLGLTPGKMPSTKNKS